MCSPDDEPGALAEMVFAPRHRRYQYIHVTPSRSGREKYVFSRDCRKLTLTDIDLPLGRAFGEGWSLLESMVP